MASDPFRADPISELARAAVRALAEGRAEGVENAIDRAYDETRVDPRTRRPTRAELRAHARAFEESEQGELGRLLRIDAALVEASEVLARLEETVIALEAHGADLPPPEIYGRAALGHFDLDPVVHIRVVTSLPVSTIAQSLFDAGFDDPACRSIETRHGRLDEVAFAGEYAQYSVVRIPPRMAVDRDRDLVKGKPVEHVDFSGVTRQLARLRVRIGRPSR
ncbi:MAG: hypothetical protein ACK5WD_11155 [bacterium]|jgi:hypothetical protein